MKLSKKAVQAYHRYLDLDLIFTNNDMRTILGHVETLDQENTELNQSNLMRLEEVKELQRKLESAALYGNKVNRLGMQARKELIETEHELKALKQFLEEEQADIQSLHRQVMEMEQEKIALVAALERAMSDHQPLVLPKDMAAELDYLLTGWSAMGVASLIGQSKGSAKTTHCRAWVYNDDKKVVERQDVILKALVNGYTAEQPITLRDEIKTLVEDWYDSTDGEDELLARILALVPETSKK